jgi:peptidoglycan/xylan/chitin deacetylase (PgdA/CDA1 family)
MVRLLSRASYKVFIILSTFLFFSHNTTYAKEVSLTFDDLPGAVENEAPELAQMNQKILNALKKFHAPAIGFVNEEKLYVDNQSKEKIGILESWIRFGNTLGNHTYSHAALSQLTNEQYKQEVIKGSFISKKLMEEAGLKYQYFRHPYLDTGAVKKQRTEFESFLKANGYTFAPVTIDTDDWKFNLELIDKPQEKNKIIHDYLAHTKKKFAFYEHVSSKMFGRQIKQIWLLHVNLINSYAIEDLLKIAQERGYIFITLTNALKDKAYTEKDDYYKPFGVSWLYRWDFTRGKTVDWSQDPEPNVNHPAIR